MPRRFSVSWRPSKSWTTCRASGPTSTAPSSSWGPDLEPPPSPGSGPKGPPALRVLGIDPGSRHTGWGVVDRRGSRLTAVAHGRISVASQGALADRLVRLTTELHKLVELHRPQVAVLESLFHGINPRSLIVLAQARGALLATVAAAGLEIREFSPAEIKSAITGSGRADKQQVDRMVRLSLGLGKVPLPPDTSDALAVAICFSQRLKMDRLARPKGSAARP
ncbi:MAG: crossover junction endodeoxyribonuclease RuvC [Acidobacteriota bacterium]